MHGTADAPPAASGAILAGGRGRRLGQDKTAIPWPPGGAGTLLAHTAGALAALCAEVLVVGYGGARPLPAGCRPVPDAFPDGGSLGGVYSALAGAETEHVLVVATDMPFLSPPLLRWMLAQPRDYDVLLPLGDRPQPLHAVWSRRCLEPLRRRLEGGRLRLTDVLADLRVREVPAAVLAREDPLGRSFFNVNTPEDLQRARALWGEAGEA
jgi:molybdopterin-guanine dinucleotide biosynthesis protein A